MISGSHNDLRRIVEKTRKDFESKSVDFELLKKLYSEYQAVPDIDLFIERAIELFPQGNCGLASLYLRHILGVGRIIQGRYEGHNHTFLMVDEEVIDITADQFGGPKLYIGKPTTPWLLNQ